MFTKIKTWCSKHKKAVIIVGGVAVGIIIGGTIIYFNRGKIGKALAKNKHVQKMIADTCSKGVAMSASTTVKTIEIIAEEELAEVCEEMEIKVITRCPHDVRGFVRNIGGKFPSQAKIAEAARYGITLGEHQTFVSPYSTGAKLLAA